MSQIGIERPKKSSIVYILQVMKSTDRLQKHVRVHEVITHVYVPIMF